MTDPISVDPGVLRKPSSHMHRDTPCLLNCKKCSGQWRADACDGWGYKLGPGVGVKWERRECQSHLCLGLQNHSG